MRGREADRVSAGGRGRDYIGIFDFCVIFVVCFVRFFGLVCVIFCVVFLFEDCLEVECGGKCLLAGGFVCGCVGFCVVLCRCLFVYRCEFEFHFKRPTRNRRSPGR
jgi:hypothetical protein